MNKAAQRALEAYPRDDDKELNFRRANYRIAYERGYEQAEKDFALTWKDMKRISRILDIMVDDDFKGEIPEEWGEEEYYEEVLRRFNKAKEEKK